MSALAMLFVDDNPKAIEAFVQRLTPIVGAGAYDTALNMQSALDAHINHAYQLCFINNNFDRNQVSVFLNDLKKVYLERKKPSLFYQLWNNKITPMQVDIARGLGFTDAISREVDKRDSAMLAKSADQVVAELEVAVFNQEIDTNMERILDELDRVARDRKRGRSTRFNTISANFVTDKTGIDHRILEKYFETLGRLSESRSSPLATYVRIPENILKKNLPELTADGYIGQSSRVWEKLLKKHGDHGANTPATAANAAAAADEKGDRSRDHSENDGSELPRK